MNSAPALRAAATNFVEPSAADSFFYAAAENLISERVRRFFFTHRADSSIDGVAITVSMLDRRDKRRRIRVTVSLDG